MTVFILETRDTISPSPAKEITPRDFALSFYDRAITETEQMRDYSHAALREMPDEPALLTGRAVIVERLRRLREEAGDAASQR